MRNKENAQNDRATGIIPTAPWRLQEVRPLEAYRLYVCFLDGLEGFVDLSPLVMDKNAGVFKPLRDPRLFEQVPLPGEVDLAPDAMYDSIKEYGEWILQ